MSKKVIYRFVDGENSADTSAPLVYTDGGRGSTTDMSVAQARSGLPETIQKDQLIFDRQERTFYVGDGAGKPQQVSDVRIFARYADRPSVGAEGVLYVSLQDHIFAVYTDGEWKQFAMSPVTVAQYYGVSTFKDKTEFPKVGEENHIYLTQDGFGYQYEPTVGYRPLFGDRTWSWTKDESDARFALKSEIPAIPSLSDLGGITPHDVDAKIQDAKDEADGKFATLSENDKKADADSVYTKTEADDKFLDKKDKPTLSSLGAVSTEQADSTFAKKAALDTLSKNVDTIQGRINKLSEYSKTTEMQKAVDDSAARIRSELAAGYMKTDDINKALSQKADAITVMKKTDMGAYALKGDIPTLTKLGGVPRDEIEATYARKTNVEALEKNVQDTYYTKTDVDAKLGDVYTKTDADAKIKAALPADKWEDFARKKEVSDTYATKDDLKAQGDKTYTKDELETRLASIQAHGVDLSKCLMKDDKPTDDYLGGKITGMLPDMTAYVKDADLLSEMIKQDRNKGSNLLLDYFANKSDIQSLELSRSRMIVDHGILTVDKEGNQFIDIKSPVMKRPELPVGHNPVKLFVNGIRYTEGEDFSFDAEANRLKWLHTDEDGFFRVTSEDELRVEYETQAAKEKAPAAKDSSKDADAVKVGIADEDLNTIQDSLRRSETAATNAKASETEAANSATAAAASAKQAADAADKMTTDRAAIDTSVKDAKDRADAAQKTAEAATPKIVNLTIPADHWNKNEAEVVSADIRRNAVIFLDLQPTADEAMQKAFADAYIDESDQRDERLTLHAVNPPAVALDIRLIIM